MDRNYYTEYFELERKHWWFRARLEIIKSQIAIVASDKTDLHILNIGAATGATSVMLEQFGKVKSVEYDQPCVDLVKEKLGIDIEHGSILELNFPDQSFDIVCAFDVIEHVEDDKKAVSEMMRVCRTNGCVMVTVPAFNSLWSVHDEVNHHYRRYTIPQLRALFSSASNILYVSYFNTILFFPVLLVRNIGKLFPFLFKRKGSGSDFGLLNNSLLNKILYQVLLFENHFLKTGIRFLAGVSAILVWRKE